MSWDEFRTRIAQALGKRTEYAIYSMGLQREPRIQSLDANHGSRFFFAREDVPARVALIREHLPLVVSETIKEADEILQHRFRLLGYRGLDYGAEIDWHLDAVHGKRAPLKAWYKIDFLNFDEVGDHKVTWELNRHQHWVTLAKAWAFTGERKYIEEIERQFYSWQKANPYPIGINWGSTLEVAFRSLSWIWVRELLGANLSPKLDRDLALGLARNGHYIERYLSTYFSPNTHLIGEALALFFIGTLCPEIPASRKWQGKGLKILTDEIQRQVRPDGVYFEQSLYYHVYALDMFLHARALAQVNEIRLPDSYDDVLQKMLHVVEVLSRNGPPLGFGDDDGGRLFNPRRNQTEHMADPLALGACLLGNAEFSATLTEEAVWLFGEKAVARCHELSAPELYSRAFEDAGLYVISSGGQFRSQMLLDAGPQGIGHSGHGHADALGLLLSVNEQPFLVDSGSYVYISPGEERNQFRGTAAHNTVRIDRQDQAVPEAPFYWSSLPTVVAEQWETGEQFTLFSGSHTGYQRLSDPVSHRRSVFHLHGEYWLVRDQLLGKSEHEAEILWHFAPGVELKADAESLHAEHNGQRLTMFGAGDSRWEATTEPGFVSPAYGEKQAAPVGIFRCKLPLPAEHGSLIVPAHAAERAGKFRMIERVADPVSGYSYQRGDTEDHIFFGQDGQSWALGSISSDADFLFLRRDRHETMTLAFCGASFVEIAGQRIFSSPARVRRCEWNPVRGAAASDPQSLKFFHAELIRAGTPVR